MSIFDKIRSGLGGSRTLIPAEAVTYTPIGVVRNPVRKSRPDGWESVKSDVILRQELTSALDAIEGFSHVIVVFHIDRVPREAQRLQVEVGNEHAPRQRGVLATRSQLRPNPIGTSVVRVLHRRQNAVRVQGLDALDGTPVLDIKPYLPAYDAVPDATLPDWATHREDA